MLPLRHMARAELGAILRKNLHCPLCSPTGVGDVMSMMAMGGGPDVEVQPLRIVAYRKTSVRLACRSCGLRFSIDVPNFATSVAERRRPPDSQIDAMARSLVKDNPADYLKALTHCRSQADAYVTEQRNEILNHHLEGLAAERPRRGTIRFPKRQPTADT